MAGPEFLYKIILTKGTEVLAEIDWGHVPGWIDKFDEELSEADRLWLIPKQSGSLLRNVSVKIGGGRRWILFSRVFGTSSAGFDKQARVYAVGWQDTKDGVNRKSITWIYPSGELEMSDEPSFGSIFLDMVK